MSHDPIKESTTKQKLAARPGVSVTVRASAGSGKTKVLVDRFVRLCVEGGEGVEGGVEPRSILAITFTRKAAVEIQERLLSRARAMALASEQELRAELRALCDPERDDFTPAELTAAAGLYEKILEDVSGLSVGTIHSFCQSILGRFASEAGLDPHAAVLENTDDLVDEALDQLEREIAADPGLAAASREAGKDPASVRASVRAMYGQRLRLDRWAHHLQPKDDDTGALLPPLRRTPLLDTMVAQVSSELFAGLDLPVGEPRPGLLEAMGSEIDSLLSGGLDRVKAGWGPDVAKAQAKSLDKKWQEIHDGLRELQVSWGNSGPEDRAALLPDLIKIFLTAKREPRVWSRVKIDDLGPLFNGLVLQEVRPLLDLFRRYSYLELLNVNSHLLRLTLRLMDICDELKQRDQVIDFQDLEDFAVQLMSEEGRALSLLYRLDDSISHILLDEFQDTNFNQWDILEHFVKEFLSGGSDTDRPHTVFVVGDVKQSIYGFRGAEPELFPLVCNLLKYYDQDHNYILPTNFRSVGAVVDAVGCLFTTAPLCEVLPPGEGENVQQLHARGEQPGPVMILDPFQGSEPAPDTGDDENRDDPGAGDSGDDNLGGDQRAAAVAVRLARELVETGEPTWERLGGQVVERPLNWGDFLVLCRSRTEIAVYEKAFRDAGIPISAAGRGTLAASREVQDVLALLRWLSYPEDDLALCTVLRSPIFRLSEGDFQMALASRGLNKVDDQGKRMPPDRLWRSLRRLPPDSPLDEAVTLLRQWRGYVGMETCHDLLRSIYREGGLLERFQAAGGDQARQNLLRLFDLALASDVSATPTVRRLVESIDRAARLAAEEEAQAPPEEDQGRVRFMTIHGAKGLESPVVFLVDADRRLGKQDPHVRLLPDENWSPLLFKVDQKFRNGIVGADLPESSVESAARRAAERGRTEDGNLLYVAMTRACDRLYVLGGQKRTNDNGESFLSQLIQAANASGCADVDREGPNWLQDGGFSWAADPITTGAGTAHPVTPSHTWTPPVLPPRVKTVTPSTLENEATEPEETRPMAGDGSSTDRQGAIERGNLVHLLLQQAADLGAMPPGVGPEHEEARAVFTNPELAWVFHPQIEAGSGLSEVPVIHREKPPLTGGPDAQESRITGIIDRLVLRPGRADIIDYKTNRTGGDTARIAHLQEHYRPQLEAYRAVVSSLFPDREVHTWLLFTEPVAGPGGGRLVEVF